MSTHVNMPETPLATRHSLLTRLKDWEDHEGWQEFFDLYWKLIYHVALKAGLNDAEAQEVVQETLITVAKNIQDFKTDPSRGSFKAWLLKTTRWRIINQFKKRRPDQIARAHRSHDDSRETATLERIPDSESADLDPVWNAEWKENQLAIALERLKRKVKPKHFQIFFLHAIREHSVGEVAKALEVNVAQVYLVKHRVAKQFKEELKRIEREMD